MRVLVLFQSNIFPITGANQQRIYQTILCISGSNQVDVVSFYEKDRQRQDTIRNLENICRVYCFPKNPRCLRYKMIRVKNRLINRLTFLKVLRRDLYDYYKRDLVSLIKNNKYDAVISEYWHWVDWFHNLPSTTLKIIDTHNINFEKHELMIQHGNIKNKSVAYKRLMNYRNTELKAYSNADILIAISKQDEQYLKNIFDNKRVKYIPIGIDAKKLERYKLQPKENTILFYGGMADQQNILAFWRLYKNIYPKVKQKIKNVKLLVVGNDPPNEIRCLDNNEDVVVTGYVEDTFPYLCESKVFVLPMMTGGGFRGRMVEVMGLGIPTVGTSNALDCINFTNGKHGFVADEDDEIVNIVIKLLSDRKYWQLISNNSKDFISKTYSMDKICQSFRDLLSTRER
jgi:glycosyltransferase involved in cell wall biosynthesis